MSRISRRDAGKLLLAGCAGWMTGRQPLFATKGVNSVVRGVQIGAESYSFRDRPLDAALQAFVTCGLGECELWYGHVHPPDLKGAALAKWGLTTPLSAFHDIREKFNRAGVPIFAFSIPFRAGMSDDEIDRGFQMAQALNVKYITSSSNVSMAPRVDEYAQRYKIMVGFHGHDQTSKPDEFSTPETFARALQGASKYLGVNLDIGHFTAAGGDALEYIRQHHGKIVTLHIKDRKKNHGANLPLGEGDTPIIAVLRLLRDQHWKIPANIEYEYGKPGMDTVSEVKKCFEYCRTALES